MESTRGRNSIRSLIYFEPALNEWVRRLAICSYDGLYNRHDLFLNSLNCQDVTINQSGPLTFVVSDAVELLVVVRAVAARVFRM